MSEMIENRKERMDLVRRAVDRAVKAGAEAAEAFLSDTQEVEIHVNGRQVEQVSVKHERGVGLRLLKAQKLVSGSSNDLSSSAVDGLVDKLMAKVGHHSVDSHCRIPTKEDGFLSGEWAARTDLITYDPEIAQTAIEGKIERALRMEAAGLDFDARITGAMMAVYFDTGGAVFFSNSNGMAGCFPFGYCGGFLYLIASDGTSQQSSIYGTAKAAYDLFDPVKVGRTAADKAIRLLGAAPIGSCEMPMVVGPDVGAELLGYLTGMLSADQAQKGKSLFAGKLDTLVASESVTVIDDGKLKGGMSTRPVDAEGIPQQTTTLIDGGRLTSFLHNCYTAGKDNVKSTGNQRRDDYRDTGDIGTTNCFLKPGDKKPEDLLARIERGFYLERAIGLHGGIDRTSGNMSLPSVGWLIEKGELTQPVQGITVNGNLIDLLKSIDEPADDLEWSYQAIGCPTFSVANVKIGGSKS